MKSARAIFFVLIILAMLVSIVAYVSGSGGDGGIGTPPPEGYLEYDITATYGADMFHQQLTAMAHDREATPAVQLP